MGGKPMYQQAVRHVLSRNRDLKWKRKNDWLYRGKMVYGLC